MITIIMIFFCFIMFCYSYLKSLLYWKIRNIPGPNPVPIFGNLKKSVLRQTHSATIYKEIYDSYPNCKVVGILRMSEPALIIRDLDIIKKIMIKDFETFSERGVVFSKDALGDNLFHTDRQTWGILKGRLSTLFTTKKIKELLPVVLNETDKVITYISNQSENSIETYQLFRKYSMFMIMAAFFDIDLNSITDTNYFNELDESIFKLTINEYLDNLIPGYMTITNSSVFGETVVNFSKTLVKNAIDDKLKNNRDPSYIMSLLLALKEQSYLKSEKGNGNDSMGNLKVTNDLLASQVFVLFAAGYENTAIILSNAMSNLANNNEVQEKLIKEIDDVISKGEEITYEKLSEMTYTEMVFKETLRLNPQTIILQRKALRDYYVPDADIKIEKGTMILISPLAIHSDEIFYPNPKTFDPERFSRENSADRHPCAYLPFGVGPRSCLGFRFSLMVFKMMMAKIFTKFTVSPTEKRHKELDPCRFLLLMKGGHHLKFEPRNLL